MDVLSILGREPAMYIDGSWVTTSETRPVINPTDESTIAAVPEADANYAKHALDAAQRAQKGWRRKAGVERGAALRAVADGIRTRQEELARLVVAEQGKTITEARGEVGDAAAGFFDYYATFERAQVGAMFAPDETNEHLLVKTVPYGVVVGIIPWNYPAALFARKVARRSRSRRSSRRPGYLPGSLTWLPAPGRSSETRWCATQSPRWSV